MSKFLNFRAKATPEERKALSKEKLIEQVEELESLYMKEARAKRFLLLLVANAAKDNDLSEIMEFVNGAITAMYQDAA